jgi:O-antigen ligase
MGRLSLLIIFYWVLLLENGPGYNLLLIDIGNGMEIRLSLIIKVIFLLINGLVLLHFYEKHTIPRFFLVMGAFLLLSTSYVLLINPGGFLAALSVNLHVLLMFNIVLFIRYNTIRKEEIKRFLEALRIFALINAVLVIISYFFPDAFTFFESGTTKTGVSRAFGIMGDEVSVFLTFFLYDALISRRPVQSGIYAIAILFTAGLGATFTAVLLLFYHLIFKMRKTRYNLYVSALLALPILVGGTLYISMKKDIGIVKRVEDTLQKTEGESVGLRFLSLSVAKEMIMERPLLGYGYGNYRKAVIDEYKPRFEEVDRMEFFQGSAQVILTYAFNPFVQMIAESGLVGLIFFIWFLVKLYRYTSVKSKPNGTTSSLINQSTRPWLLIFIISTQSVNWFLPSSVLLLLVVTLVGINSRLKELDFAETAQETI